MCQQTATFLQHDEVRVQAGGGVGIFAGLVQTRGCAAVQFQIRWLIARLANVTDAHVNTQIMEA